MRTLHTSDWHLGRSFGPASLSAAQEQFCDHLIDVTTAEKIDLVVIAGDIYDRAIAPTESIELFRDTVRRLRSCGAVVAAISGNHDGADRVSPYDDLLDASGVYIRGGYEGVGRVVTHEFSDGPVELVLLPFLEPRAAPDDFAETAGDETAIDETAIDETARDETASTGALERRRRRTHHSVLATAVDSARAQSKNIRSIAVAHAFVTGGTVTDSERQLEVGGTGEVPASLFDGFSYTALGHLHRPQQIGRPTLRYSGTPMPYSFSEDHPKSLVIVDMDTAGTCSVDTVVIDIGRKVTTIRGDIDDLLHPDAHPEAHDRFVRAVVTDRATVLDAKARLEQRYPHVVEIRLEPDGAPAELVRPDTGPDRLTPIDAITSFWTTTEGSPPDSDTAELFHRAVTAATEEPS